MPLYRVKCPHCEVQDDVFRKMSEYDDLPLHCGVKMERVVCAPAVHADITPYVSPGSGKYITSRSQMKEDLRATGSILNEPGLRKDVARWGEEKREKDFAPIAAGVDEAVKKLVATSQIES